MFPIRTLAEAPIAVLVKKQNERPGRIPPSAKHFFLILVVLGIKSDSIN